MVCDQCAIACVGRHDCYDCLQVKCGKCSTYRQCKWCNCSICDGCSSIHFTTCKKMHLPWLGGEEEQQDGEVEEQQMGVEEEQQQHQQQQQHSIREQGSPVPSATQCEQCDGQGQQQQQLQQQQVSGDTRRRESFSFAGLSHRMSIDRFSPVVSVPWGLR